jgi:hypothetical protein
MLFILLIGVVWLARPARATAVGPDTGGAH